MSKSQQTSAWYGRMIFLCFGQVLLTFATLLFPRWVGIYIDILIPSETKAGHGSSLQLWQMLLFVIILAFLTYLFTHLQIRFVNHWLKELRNLSLRKMMTIDLSVQNSQKPSLYSTRIVHDMDAFKEGLGMGVWQLPAQVFLLIGSLWLLGKMNIYLACIVLFLAPQCMWLTSLIATRSKKKYQQQQELHTQMLAMVDEDIAQPALLKALGLLTFREEKYKKLNLNLLQVGQKAQFYSSLTNPVARLVNHLTYISVGICAVILSMRGVLTYGEIAAALSYTLLFAEPINQLSLVYGQLQKALVSWKRFHELFSWPNVNAEGKVKASLIDEDIKMENVSFSYHKDESFIQNLNLTFPKGKMTALVGGTGSGKTTLVHLLLRFYQPDKGHIYFGRQDIQDLDLESFYQQIGFILQEAWLFTGTVAENIAYGLKNICLDDVKRAAKQACANHFIERLPKGYDTILGTGGHQLSQGEKQLLTLARIFLRKPPILIFDEATSNVDIQTEQKVQEGLRNLMKGRTSIIIAHRLATIQAADQILVMDEGQIVEKGRHEELLARHGYYARMYESQFH